MGTNIEWCQETWNPITGCTPISPGCKNCYAERMAKRLAGRFGYPKDYPFAITLHESQFKKPLKWRKPRMVFVCSMGDLFHEDVPFEWIYVVVKAIISAHMRNPVHKWLFLTKRPQRILDWREWSKTMPYTDAAQVCAWFQKMAWLGVTAENQEQADKRIPILLQIPAAVRFVSVEPMLGPVNLRHMDAEGHHPEWCWIDALTGKHTDMGRASPDVPKLDWVIAGGESGPGARPMHPDWARSLRDQCQDAGVPFFFKQWGAFGTKAYNLSTMEPVFREYKAFHTWVNKADTWSEGATHIDINGDVCNRGRDFQRAKYPVAIMHRVGKKKAGRLLDGRTHDEYPEVA